jgi:hypothetical protein
MKDEELKRKRIFMVYPLSFFLASADVELMLQKSKDNTELLYLGLSRNLHFQRFPKGNGLLFFL